MKINGNIIEIVNYRRDKAFETLDDIQKLLKNNMLALAMNRVYYSGFYIVSALSLLDNKKFSKHKMLIGYFNKEYLMNMKDFVKEIDKIIQEKISNLQ